MSTAPIPGHRKPKHKRTTVVLAALHGALAYLTLLLGGFILLLSLDDPHGECEIHGLHCDRGAHMREAVVIGVSESVALIVVDILMLVLLRRHRGVAVVVPLLCCIGQFVIMGGISMSDNSVVVTS